MPFLGFLRSLKGLFGFSLGSPGGAQQKRWRFESALGFSISTRRFLEPPWGAVGALLGAFEPLPGALRAIIGALALHFGVASRPRNPIRSKKAPRRMASTQVTSRGDSVLSGPWSESSRSPSGRLAAAFGPRGRALEAISNQVGVSRAVREASLA